MTTKTKDEYYKEFFSKNAIWKPGEVNQKEHEVIASEISDEETVLDVGCGYNQLKGKVKNLENEIIGYRNTLKLLENLNNYMDILPEDAVKYFNIYQNYFN